MDSVFDLRSLSFDAQYSYVYNAISDWIYNGSNIQDEVGALADPSLMTYYYNLDIKYF